jgi:hypothetical protein
LLIFVGKEWPFSLSKRSPTRKAAQSGNTPGSRTTSVRSRGLRARSGGAGLRLGGALGTRLWGRGVAGRTGRRPPARTCTFAGRGGAGRDLALRPHPGTGVGLELKVKRMARQTVPATSSQFSKLGPSGRRPGAGTSRRRFGLRGRGPQRRERGREASHLPLGTPPISASS